jgi:hypothetical protein
LFAVVCLSQFFDCVFHIFLFFVICVSHFELFFGHCHIVRVFCLFCFGCLSCLVCFLVAAVLFCHARAMFFIGFFGSHVFFAKTDLVRDLLPLALPCCSNDYGGAKSGEKRISLRKGEI